MPIDFDEKARENIGAAMRLLPDDDGVFEGWPNAAASRAYYAVYLAVAHTAQARGMPFTHVEKQYYKHDTLADDAARLGIIDDDEHDVLTMLLGLRIKADYWEDHVNLAEAAEAAQQAEAMVSALLGARA